MLPHPYQKVDAALILDRERPLLALVRDGGLRSAGYSSETEDWLACQRYLNHLLGSFLNGDGSFSRRRPADWIYRYIQPRPEFWHVPARLAGAEPYSRRLTKVLGADTVTATTLYAALNEADEFLSTVPASIEVRPKKAAASLTAAGGPEASVIHRVRRLLAPLGSCVSAFLHGSMATRDSTPFSDVDDLVIVHRSAWQSYARFKDVAGRMESAARLFQRIDPLQHHGHWVFSDLDMACLDEATMPLVVLGRAVCVAGRREVSAGVRTDVSGFGRVLWDILQEVRREAIAMGRGQLNLFGLKNLLSSISLLPPLVFQIGHQMLDKKTAILRSEEVFSGRALPAIRWATSLRQEWSHAPGFYHVSTLRRLNQLLPFRRIALQEIASRQLPRLSFGQIPHSGDVLLASLFHLTDEAAEHLWRGLRRVA